MKIENPASAAIAITCSLVSVGLAASLPIAAAAHAVTADALVVRLASHLLAGEWLGSYGAGTLMAGAPYAALAAKAAAFGVPLKAAEAVVQLAAAGVAAGVLSRLGLTALGSLAVFVLLAFNPAPWSPLLMRVTGEAFAGSLALIAVALAAFVFLAEAVRARTRRIALAALSLAFAFFWLQDPAGAWLIPALALPALPLLPRFVRAVRARPSEPAALRAAAAPALIDIAAAALPFVIVTGVVAALNLAHYGAFTTSEAHGGAFVRAIGALTRITPAAASARFELAGDVAAHAARVSGAMRELKPHLDGAIGQRWRAAGCRTLKVSPCPAGFGGGTLIWALRDAAAAAGHMHDAAQASAFFARLAREIDGACASGDVPCGPSRASLISPLRTGEWRTLPYAFARALAVTTQLGGGEAGAAPSEGSPAELDAFARIAGAVTAPAQSSVALAGWIAAAECLPRPAIVERDGARQLAEMSAADDVDAFFRQKGQYPRTQRFKLSSPCADGECVLKLEGCGPDAGAPVWSLAPGMQARGGTMLFLDSVSGTDADTAPAADDGWAAGLARWFASLYSAVGPVVAPFGLVMFVLAWIGSGDYRDLRKPLVFAAACFVAVVARAGVVALIDTTTMPAADIRNMAPAAPFFILFTALSAILALTALRRRLRAEAQGTT